MQSKLTRREGSSLATHASISPWLTSYRGEMTPHLLSLQILARVNPDPALITDKLHRLAANNDHWAVHMAGSC